MNQSNLSEHRKSWMGVLAQATLAELEEIWAGLRHPPNHEWIRKPEVGASMIRARASVSGVLFNLGEVTVTRCTLQIDSGEIGVSYVMGRSRKHAALAALLDAVLQREKNAGQSGMMLAVERLADLAKARRDAAVREADATKVEFFMMNRESDGE